MIEGFRYKQTFPIISVLYLFYFHYSFSLPIPQDVQANIQYLIAVFLIGLDICSDNGGTQ